MSKKKNELANVLNDCAEICADIISAAELITKAGKTALKAISAARTIFEIPERAEEALGETKEEAAVAEGNEPIQQTEEEKPVEEMPAAKEYSKADVRKFLAGVAKQHRAEVKSLLMKYGADNLTQLDPAHYAAIMADAEEIANA